MSGVAEIPQRSGHTFRATMSRPAQLRPAVWLPGIAYCLWLDRLVLGTVGYASAAHELEAVAFLISQTLLLFLPVILVDGLLAVGALRSWRMIFVAGVYLFLGALYIDALLYKLMALHLWRGLGILLEGGLSHLGRNWADTGVCASAVPGWLGWGGAVCSFILLFALVSAKACFGRALRVPLGRLLLVGGYLLLVCQILSTGDDTQWILTLGELRAALPIYLGASVPVPGRKYKVPPLKALQDFSAVPARATAGTGGPAPRPDIFVFVLESIRGDFITPEITPSLAAFSAECLHFPDTLASGNASHISWYSLLTANYGLRFGAAKRAPRRPGSVPLALLKRAGYKINVLCSSTLDYHEIDKLAFGEKLELCDSMFDAQKQRGGDAPERDLAVNQALLRALQQPSGARLFLVFYHSTHHDYDWPANDPAPFIPYARTWNYGDFNIGKNQLRLIMNRYRNALYFQDRLVQNVFSALKSNGEYSRAIIVVTGDHGEEFLEHGKLLHASNLFRPQTHVPFLFRLSADLAASHSPPPKLPLASHVDLLPTLLDCLGIQASNSFDGQSLLHKSFNQVVITAENADFDPVRFCIQSSRYKAFFEYEDPSRPTAEQHTLYLKSVTDTQDGPVTCGTYSAAGRELLDANFQAAFESLYPGATLGGTK
ncbi:MAG TPA: sulfatase-like hydrolase/transferase [Verrucomicrobiae bacterium]|nr:sulfatase-like hydrolase/transferase [Verrucomicrobiae bacterium]